MICLFSVVRKEKSLSTSPAGAYAIGQYFKNNDSLNREDGGNRAGEGSIGHVLSHGLLALAVGSATEQSPETITTTTSGVNVSTGTLTPGERTWQIGAISKFTLGLGFNQGANISSNGSMSYTFEGSMGG